MFGKINKKLSGGGLNDPVNVSLPFTATHDGFCLVRVRCDGTYLTNKLGILYISEDTAENFVCCIIGSNSGAFTDMFPIRKGHTYTNSYEQNITEMNIKVYSLAN